MARKKKNPKSKASGKAATTEANATDKVSTEVADNVPSSTVAVAKKGRSISQSSAKDGESDTASSPQSFQSLHPPLSEGVLDFVTSQNFTRMTPVQAATIPLFLSSKDVAVQAVTGSGKTLAFLVPLMEVIQKKKFKRQQIAALVLSPTRELAHQTHRVAKGLCASCKLPEPLLLVGGSSSSSSSSSSRPVTEDLRSFQALGSNLLIGTPGRVEDILSRYTVMGTSELEYLILDEADVLLNMGFATTLQNILSRLPKMRRTGLFSATTNTSTNSSLKEWMVRAGLRNPVWIDVAVSSNPKEKSNNSLIARSKQQATPSSLSNYYLVCPMDEQLTRLATFLEDHKDETVIVFFLTCACVEFYGTVLQQLLPNNYIESLHGKMVQKRREKSMERFRQCASSDGEGNGGALLCTDVAARGLDLPNVHWVVQFDAPQDPSFYVHRVGRSGRAGKVGNSLLFLTQKEEAYVDLLNMRKVPLSPLSPSERCCPPDMIEEDDDDAEKSAKRKPPADTTDDDEGPDEKTRVILSARDPKERLNDILPKVRGLALRDRDVLEKGTKAYTSYIRAYKEHQCAFIFRFASLDLGLLATCFCLLRLPKMPELRQAVQKHKGRLPRFTPAGPDVDIFAIPFKDKAREKARQKRLEQELATGGKNAKLIQAERKKAEKEKKHKERRETAVAKGRNPDKKRGRQAKIMDEWDDLAKEERLYKKLRKGKISKEQFEEKMYG